MINTNTAKRRSTRRPNATNFGSSMSRFRRQHTEKEQKGFTKQDDGEVIISLLEDSYPETGRTSTKAAAAAAISPQANKNDTVFISHGNVNPGSFRSRCSSIFSSRTIRIVMFLFGVLCGIFLFLAATDSDFDSGVVRKSAQLLKSRARISKNGIKFRCPSRFQLGSEDEECADQYAEETLEMDSDKKKFLATYKEVEFDQWDNTYTNVKKGLEPFKSKYYPKYLKDGMSIYESAMGTGLNLFMTLEILKEQDLPISGITVYGNDFVSESIDHAVSVILADDVIPAGNHQGVLCAGNSLDLSHVPSSVFDLVYTGYITPVMDPLHIVTDGKDIDDDDRLDTDWDQYDQICTAFEKNEEKKKDGNNNEDSKKHWMGAYLWEKVIVEQQSERYGKWVGEMARIAKPGVPVIVESVSVSYCENSGDWGGVPRSFWHEAARENTYNWNVVPESIEMMDDTLNEGRYHVFMLKKKRW